MSDNKRMGSTSVDCSCLGVRFADGTYQMTAASGNVPNVQTVRLPYTINSSDNDNGYIIVLVTFPQAFADNNYTAVCGWENVEDSQFNGITLNFVKTSRVPGQGPATVGVGLAAGVGMQVTITANNGFASVGNQCVLHVIAIHD